MKLTVNDSNAYMVNKEQNIDNSKQLITIREPSVTIDNCVQENVPTAHDANENCKSYVSCPVDSSCRCDRGFHIIPEIKDLGQSAWAKISKKQLSKIDIQLLDNKCQALSQFMAQQPQQTGFVPLSPLQFEEIRQCGKSIYDPELCKNPVKLYNFVNSFHCPNFLGARVQVNYTMNLDLIDKLAEGYWDWHLPLLLRYGFPMDFKGTHEDLISCSDSHPSALQFPDHVTAYLQDEIHHQAIFGPFKHKPFGEITHISPFITRNKQDSDKRRVIIDLSWPIGASVNCRTDSNEYMGTAFKLCYPSVDTFTDRLRQLGRGALMHKIDLSRAFRQLKVDPADYPLLCLAGSVLRGRLVHVRPSYGGHGV